MPSVSLPVTRPTGRALLVGAPDRREKPLGLLQEIGFVCVECDDPYAGMVELSRRPQVFSAVILSLQSVYREELDLISTLKRRVPHVEIWLTDTDGRPAAMADAMRHGADGLLAEDGLHRVAMAAAAGPLVRENGTSQSGRVGRSGRARTKRLPESSPHLESTPAPLEPSALVDPPAPAVSPPAPAAYSDGAGQEEHAGNGASNGAGQPPRHSRPDLFDDGDTAGDAVLSAEELRALLHEPPDRR